jgi:hypothetical protein
MIMDWIDDNFGELLLIGIPAFFALMLWASIADQEQWDGYAKEHHCVAVGIKRGQASTGLSMDGKGSMVTTYTPDQTIYHCDNGEIEIR